MRFWLSGCGRPGAAADETARLLTELGFETAIDLQLLLAGGLEAAEMMGELQSAGVSIGDRGKVRLLVGDRAENLGRLYAAPVLQQSSAADGMTDVTSTGNDQQERHHIMMDKHRNGDNSRRRLQEKDSGSMSMDTVAIVLTVLVGSAG